jgi:hypothetical protein
VELGELALHAATLARTAWKATRDGGEARKGLGCRIGQPMTGRDKDTMTEGQGGRPVVVEGLGSPSCWAVGPSDGGKGEANCHRLCAGRSYWHGGAVAVAVGSSVLAGLRPGPRRGDEKVNRQFKFAAF